MEGLKRVATAAAGRKLSGQLASRGGVVLFLPWAWAWLRGRGCARSSVWDNIALCQTIQRLRRWRCPGCDAGRIQLVTVTLYRRCPWALACVRACLIVLHIVLYVVVYRCTMYVVHLWLHV